MKTVCIRIPGITSRPNCKKLNEESITISNVAGKPRGFFTIHVKGPITVSLLFGEKLLIMNAGTSYPNPGGSPTNKCILGSAGTYAFLIVKSVFHDALIFSDITQVTRFDASTNAPDPNGGYENSKGLEVPAHELMKFSLMQDIGLRYALTGINKKTVLDLRAFRNVTRLYLGTANTTTNYLEDIILENETMQKLKDLNIAPNRIPYNFNELSACNSLILHSSPTWQNIRHLYPDMDIAWKQEESLIFTGITSNNPEDFPYILHFLHAMAVKKILYTVQAPDFTINPEFMNTANVGKLKDICVAVRDKNETFTIGGHIVSLGQNNCILINGKSYPYS